MQPIEWERRNPMGSTGACGGTSLWSKSWDGHQTPCSVPNGLMPSLEDAGGRTGRLSRHPPIRRWA